MNPAVGGAEAPGKSPTCSPLALFTPRKTPASDSTVAEGPNAVRGLLDGVGSVCLIYSKLKTSRTNLQRHRVCVRVFWGGR